MQFEMESDLSMALAMSLIQNKPAGMDIVDYVTSVKSKIMEKDNELFFQEFLCDSEPNKPPDQQLVQDDLSSYLLDSQSFENLYDNNMASTSTVLFDRELSSGITSDLITKSNTSLVQPVITMKTLNEMSTNNWNTDTENTNQKYIDVMVQSIQKALDYLMYTLFDNTRLIETVTNWDDCNNLVRYFADLVASMAENIELGFTCRDSVMMFVQNTAFKILDSHHVYNSIHVEYQCNLLAKFCCNKFIRWNLINLLINRLNIDVQVVPNSSSLRSIFYTFHLIDKLLHNIDFDVTTAMTNDKYSLTDLWKINRTNNSENETEIMKQMLKKWTDSLEYISAEALRKNVFLLSIRANQCLESLKSITFE